MKHRSTLFLLIFSLIICFFLNGASTSIYEYINVLFLLSLVLLMIGCSLLLMEKGAFNNILFSFKIFYNRMTKVGEYAFELDKNETIIRSFQFKYTETILFAGMILFLFSFSAAVVFL